MTLSPEEDPAENDASRLEPGDHLRVRRFGLYWHHGIYVSDERVIEFGGGSLLEKHRAVVRPVLLGEFEKRGRAEVVLPRASLAQEVIDRAEYVCTCPTRGMYNFLGSNCEHLATWCMSSDFWSDQVASYAWPMALIPVFVFSSRKASPRLEKATWAIASIVLYNAVVRRLARARWKKLLNKCPVPGSEVRRQLLP